MLHYTANSAPLRDGDLLLIDAGCSLADYYNGDITRTFPISGRFSAEQRALPELVLVAQEAAIAAVAPGQTTEGVHATALRVLVEGLLEFGLLAGSSDGIIEQGAYRHLYMHRTGHWLGLDVHDVGAYRLGEHHAELETGMVLTVEPGLYVSDRLPVPEGQPAIEERWKGIGIRIEDDVAVKNFNIRCHKIVKNTIYVFAAVVSAQGSLASIDVARLLTSSSSYKETMGFDEITHLDKEGAVSKGIQS